MSILFGFPIAIVVKMSLARVMFSAISVDASKRPFWKYRKPTDFCQVNEA